MMMMMMMEVDDVLLIRCLPWGYHDHSAQEEDQLSSVTDILTIRYQAVAPSILPVFLQLFQGLFVIVAWLSLFLPPQAIPGRVTMSMTTLLTLAAMFGSVRQNTPRVSYVSALDVWMCGCIIFVFFTLFEYVVVLW